MIAFVDCAAIADEMTARNSVEGLRFRVFFSPTENGLDVVAIDAGRNFGRSFLPYHEIDNTDGRRRVEAEVIALLRKVQRDAI